MDIPNYSQPKYPPCAHIFTNTRQPKFCKNLVHPITTHTLSVPRGSHSMHTYIILHKCLPSLHTNTYTRHPKLVQIWSILSPPTPSPTPSLFREVLNPVHTLNISNLTTHQVYILYIHSDSQGTLILSKSGPYYHHLHPIGSERVSLSCTHIYLEPNCLPCLHTYTYTRHPTFVKIWSILSPPIPSRFREGLHLVHTYYIFNLSTHHVHIFPQTKGNPNL